VKKPQIKKRTATFFRMHSNRFMRVPVSWQAACGD
jgi:ribosomal protein L32E